MKSLKFKGNHNDCLLGIIILFLALWSIEGLLAREEKLAPFIYSNEGNNEAWLTAEDRKIIATAITARLKELQVAMGGNEDENVSVEGNGDALKKYMEENPNGIVVMDTTEAPETIFTKEDDTFVEKWLENGGIMIWESYYPFRMRGHERVPKKVSRNVFDLNRDIQKPLRPKENTQPTALGKRFMPSLKPFETFIPVDIATLDELNFKYEVYSIVGENDEYADPIMFHSPNMKGWFMYHHMNQYTDIADWGKSTMKGGMAEQIGTEIAEFIVNRFSFYSVKLVGKVATTWGRVKGKVQYELTFN